MLGSFRRQCFALTAESRACLCLDAWWLETRRIVSYRRPIPLSCRFTWILLGNQQQGPRYPSRGALCLLFLDSLQNQSRRGCPFFPLSLSLVSNETTADASFLAITFGPNCPLAALHPGRQCLRSTRRRRCSQLRLVPKMQIQGSNEPRPLNCLYYWFSATRFRAQTGSRKQSVSSQPVSGEDGWSPPAGPAMPVYLGNGSTIRKAPPHSFKPIVVRKVLASKKADR